MRQNLIKLSLFLESESLLRESWGIYRLIKLARTKNLVRTIFLTFYPEEVRGKVVSVSQSYYKTFKDFDPERLTEESLMAFLQENTLEDIILVLRDHKDKERDAVAETAVNRFLNSKELIPDELKKELLDEHEAGLIRLEESDVSKKNYAWAVKIFLNEEQDPMEEVIEAIRTWDSAKHNLKDLYEYEKLSDLRRSFDGLGVESKRAYYYSIKQHAVNERNTDIIYDSNNFTVVLCGTTQSSQWWAQGTVWCTAALTGNMFDHYSSKGIYLYYLIAKSDEAFENYTPKGWSGIYGRGWSFKEKKNAFKKISIGYTKKDNDIIFLSRQNATVDSNNHDISKDEILDFLGDEGLSVFSAIENDLTGRDSTKFEEIRRSATPEDLKQALELYGEEDAGSKYDLVRGFANSKDAKKETIEYAVSLLAKNEVADWSPYNFFVREYESRELRENHPDLWDKYSYIAFKNMATSKESAAIFLGENHHRAYPEFMDDALDNLVVTPGEKRVHLESGYDYGYDYDYYDYETRRDRDSTYMGLGDLSHFIDLNGELLEKEASKKRIKEILDKAILDADVNILEFKKRILNKIYEENPDFDSLVLAPLIKKVISVEEGQSPYAAALFFHNTFEWHKHFPELKDYALEMIISSEPEKLYHPPSGVNPLVDTFPELLPVALWGMTLKAIFEQDLHSKHPDIAFRLVAQINDGGRKAIHPKLFSVNHRDHMRSHDLDSLSVPKYRDIFSSILRSRRDDPDDFQDQVDERELGMNLDHMRKEHGELSEELSHDMQQARFPRMPSGERHLIRKNLEEEFVKLKDEEAGSEQNFKQIHEEGANTTWEEKFPELQNIIQNRRARISKLYQMMKRSRKGEGL